MTQELKVCIEALQPHPQILYKPRTPGLVPSIVLSQTRRVIGLGSAEVLGPKCPSSRGSYYHCILRPHHPTRKSQICEYMTWAYGARQNDG